jgi:L-lactate dehydrogenase complex protein LldF
MSSQPVTFLGRASNLIDTPQSLAVNQGVRRLDGRRQAAAAEFPGMEAMRDRVRAIRLHSLTHLDRLLTQFADQLAEAGGVVHFAADADEANRVVAGILRDTGSRRVVKAKSMVSEEIELNPYLQAKGFSVVETDLGEFIVQLAGDTPSHIIAPVLHMNRYDIGKLFAEKLRVPETSDPSELNTIARTHLREMFLAADAGITGVNLAIAETGSIVTVTNEGNGRLCTSAPPVHIALMGMERIVSNWEEAAATLEVLARSATGQSLSVYTNVITGPRREGDVDGPGQVHVVIIDNGRSQVLGSDIAEILACIRCGACLNICPVFREVGGHAYGTVYSGPVGSVLTPGLYGMNPWWELPYASTLCGACEEVCPVRIQIPSMLLKLREHAASEGHLPGWLERGMRRYRTAAIEPDRWRSARRWARLLLGLFSSSGWIRRIPGPGRGWTRHRDMRRPAEQSFSDWFKARNGS